MEVAERCSICQANTPCGCQGAMVCYFKLLDAVQQRVLRVKPASQAGHLPVASAGIDKLNAYFPESVKTEAIMTNARQYGHEIKRVYLKDRKPYLEVGNGKCSAHLRLGFYETDVSGLISNPNRFESWQTYLGFVSEILPHDSIKKAQVSRLDLNLDFAFSFSTLIQSLDIKNKRSALTFLDESGKRTGLIIGKGKENIEIYDKAHKNNLSTPLTRVELRLGGGKLPTRSICDVPTVIQSRNFFDGLEGFTLAFKETVTNVEQSQRISDFKSNLNRDGFYSAKRSMNQSRNFDRDFGKLLQIKSWDVQPSQLFKNKINQFIQTKENLIWMNQTKEQKLAH